jgi:hypothetical protein
MEVIRARSLREEIDKEINKNPITLGIIQRIQLSRKEFSFFVSELDRWQDVIDKRADVSLSSRGKNAQNWDVLIYRDVVIQTHGDYI